MRADMSGPVIILSQSTPEAFPRACLNVLVTSSGPALGHMSGAPFLPRSLELPGRGRSAARSVGGCVAGFARLLRMTVGEDAANRFARPCDAAAVTRILSAPP